MNWPQRIPAGQVIGEVGAAMDVFPTFLAAAGGDPSEYQLDGLDILRTVGNGEPTPQRDIYWEMGKQTAVRRGNWKLVLNGQLVEGAPPEDDVHLADLETDMGETENLKDAHSELTAELTNAAQTWREGIETHWETEWVNPNGTTGYVKES